MFVNEARGELAIKLVVVGSDLDANATLDAMHAWAAGAGRTVDSVAMPNENVVDFRLAPRTAKLRCFAMHSGVLRGKQIVVVVYAVPDAAGDAREVSLRGADAVVLAVAPNAIEEARSRLAGVGMKVVVVGALGSAGAAADLRGALGLAGDVAVHDVVPATGTGIADVVKSVLGAVMRAAR